MNRIIDQQQAYRFMALGMANDQAKIEFFHEDHLPLPIEYLERDELVEQLAAALNLCEDCGFRLKVASQWLALLMLSPKYDGLDWGKVDKISKQQAEALAVHWNTARHYWQLLEIPFQHLLEDLREKPEAMDEWIETIRQAAWEALEQSIGYAGNDAPALKAGVRSRGILGASLKKLFPEEEKEVPA